MKTSKISNRSFARSKGFAPTAFNEGCILTDLKAQLPHCFLPTHIKAWKISLEMLLFKIFEKFYDTPVLALNDFPPSSKNDVNYNKKILFWIARDIVKNNLIQLASAAANDPNYILNFQQKLFDYLTILYQPFSASLNYSSQIDLQEFWKDVQILDVVRFKVLTKANNFILALYVPQNFYKRIKQGYPYSPNFYFGPFRSSQKYELHAHNLDQYIIKWILCKPDLTIGLSTEWLSEYLYFIQNVPDDIKKNIIDQSENLNICFNKLYVQNSDDLESYKARNNEVYLPHFWSSYVRPKYKKKLGEIYE